MSEKYIIGVDGGGTKTTVALADERGNIIRAKTGGPSNPRNLGVTSATTTISRLINEITEDKEISASFIALPAVEEEYSGNKEEIKSILKKGGLKGFIKIGSDQLAAFRSGTTESNGVAVIAGTGAVVHAWKNNREAVVSGWGYLADEGSAFHIGIEGFRVIAKDLDGRGEHTEITKILLQKWEVNSANEVRRKIYSDFKTFIPQICIFIEEAATRGDYVASELLKKGGEEVALSLKTAIKELSMEKSSFPVVFCGGMFRSQIFRNLVEKELLKVASKAEVIFPHVEPVKGAVDLAREILI